MENNRNFTLMQFKYFAPHASLRPYIKHYYLFEYGSGAAFEDVVFPSGDMEIIFNLGAGAWEALAGGEYIKNPRVELWGQVTRPMPIRAAGKQVMLGIKFFTHSASFILNDEISLFNDKVTDVESLLGNTIKALHTQLLEASGTAMRLELLDAFMLKQFAVNDKKSGSVQKIAGILSSIKGNVEESNMGNIATSYGITPRYLHKLIYRHTGLSSSYINKINRFQYSLKLISKNNQHLTGIAYDCGYFDQSHFIRDFKSFTGVTPSAYLENITPVNQLLLQ